MVNQTISELHLRENRLLKYNEVIQTLYRVDVSSNREFQKNFNSFYKVRRNADWQKIYYDYFEKNKENKELNFREIVEYIYEKTGRIEASFSSKMLATINQSMPVWDKFVLQNLGFKTTKKLPQDRIAEAATIYEKLIEWHKLNLQTEEAKQFFEVFNSEFPQYKHFSEIKKADLKLWVQRE